MNVGYFYIISMLDTNFHKVGVSKTPGLRLQGLQTSNPLKLIIRMTLYCRNPRDLEARVLQRLASYRQQGEWFKMQYEKLYRAVLEESDDLLLDDNNSVLEEVLLHE